ncbi:MAG: hypothetical protein ACXADD_19740, partial [Candidatus Thorarchaeota archaeon]
MNEPEAIGKFIEQNIDRHIEKLRELVKQPSIGVEGYGTRECAALIHDWMVELGFDSVDLYAADANPIVFGEIKSDKPDAGKT